MTFSPKLKSVVNKMIDSGEYILRDNELIFVLDPSQDDRYIYSSGKKWRVIIPHAEDPKKKISVGYYTSKDQARRMRDVYLRQENREHGDEALQDFLKGHK